MSAYMQIANGGSIIFHKRLFTNLVINYKYDVCVKMKSATNYDVKMIERKSQLACCKLGAPGTQNYVYTVV